MTIYRGSRYEQTKIYTFYDFNTAEGVMSLPKTVPTLQRRNLSILNHGDSQSHVWKSGDRVDLLAYSAYGDARKWWVILDANPQYLSPWDIKEGDIIIIPSYQSMRSGLKDVSY